jgi:hypothetical protein
MLERSSGNSRIIPEQTSNQEELRANRNVKTKPVSSETLAFEGPSARGMGWVLAANRVRHSIMSVRPQAGHDNNIVPCQATLYLMRYPPLPEA